jgi:hypothetical protein
MANDILKKLEASPNEEFLSENHGEAVRWLLDLDLAREMPPDSATRPFIGAFNGCNTHWIVVRVVHGDPRPGADGIYVSCLPRSAVSGEKLKKRLIEIYGGKVTVNRPPV